jgi:dTMP kinase
MKGKLIVFEGIDGSGKSTQSRLLSERLRAEGYKTASFDFPQYGTKSAGLVEEYLAGKYGSAKEVGPYRASVFYASDRHDASFLIKKLLDEGRVVITDRYVGSNIGHQGGKIARAKERSKFFKWLYELEYEIFGIPKPVQSFLLNVGPGIAGRLADNPERRKIKKKDMHEADARHLLQAHRAYMSAAKQFPKDFTVINCVKNGAILPPEVIHEKVWGHVKKLIQ